MVLVEHCKKSIGAYWHHGVSWSPRRAKQIGRNVEFIRCLRLRHKNYQNWSQISAVELIVGIC